MRDVQYHGSLQRWTKLLLRGEAGEGVLEYLLMAALIIIGSITVLRLVGCGIALKYDLVTVGVANSVPAH